ncbi:MAG TPA: acyl carrier protein [Thermoanaerobaculia bacterium]|nr:acyl carrier protein [Thermoanaerobaculia bacterium]
MSTQVLEHVRTLAADVLGVRRSEIDVNSTPRQLDNWDSISHVSLVLAIEEQFGVAFTPEEITDMESIGRIAELLSRKLNNGNSH